MTGYWSLRKMFISSTLAVEFGTNMVPPFVSSLNGYQSTFRSSRAVIKTLPPDRWHPNELPQLVEVVGIIRCIIAVYDIAVHVKWSRPRTSW